MERLQLPLVATAQSFYTHLHIGLRSGDLQANL
jgi:hypothetical protein